MIVFLTGTGAALAAFVVIVWSATFVNTKALLADFSALEILALRFAMAWVALWAIHPRGMGPLRRRDEALFAAAGLANDAFQQCRTLYNQLNLSATMRELLPHGLFGLFALLLFLAMLSTDDSRIYSATLAIAQDVVLPLRKRPFTPRQHIWMVRIVAMSIGVFFLCGSCYMKQLDFYQMFNTLACAMWIGASGSIMIFGLYSRFGTTWGAWAALSTSVALRAIHQVDDGPGALPGERDRVQLLPLAAVRRRLRDGLARHVPQAVQPGAHAAPRPSGSASAASSDCGSSSAT
ncbi:MAG: hypothetical protein IJ678_01790 [Kiritimatiellae bacterium]|nr:hypothetical protein [Kiritimatiellia bacterium]